MKILGKTQKKIYISKNKHFEVFFFFLKKIDIYHLSYLIIIFFVLIKNINFYKCTFIIKLHYILFYNNIVITCLILKYIIIKIMIHFNSNIFNDMK